MQTFSKKGLSEGFKQLEEERAKIEELRSSLVLSLAESDKLKLKFIDQRKATESATKLHEQLNKELRDKLASLEGKENALSDDIYNHSKEANNYRLKCDQLDIRIDSYGKMQKEHEDKMKALNISKNNLSEKQEQSDKLIKEHREQLTELESLKSELEGIKAEYSSKLKTVNEKEETNGRLLKSLEKDQKDIKNEWLRINKEIRDRRLKLEEHK